MDLPHPLKTLLQLHVASDGNAVLHLPYILSSLTSQALEPSPHSQKWMTRINSLIHSKDRGARWAGLCIALRTSVLSKPIMFECAQSWVTASLSLVSRNESLPVLKACIRLLRYIFTSTTSISEFQRQVAMPNVPKFSTALLTIVDKNDDTELKVLSLNSLSHLVASHPTLHRTLQAQLNSTALRYLDGSSPKPLPQALVEASSGLYSVLHHLGGKVGAAPQWRKHVDDTIQFAWNALSNLRTTYEQGGEAPQTTGDPLISIPPNADRLRIAVKVLSDLLQTSHPRPVPVPLGPLVKLCIALLSCTREGQAEGHIDPTLHMLESSIVSNIQTFGCVLLQNLASSSRQGLTPHLTQLYYSITLLFEQKQTTTQQLPLLQTASALLTHCPGLTDTQLPSRLLRAILPNLTFLLAPQSEAQKNTPQDESSQIGRSKKGKRRARGYEGDEVFKVNRGILCPTAEAGEVTLATLDVVQQLLQNSSLSPSIQSLAGRILLALYTSLPHLTPSLLSHDLSLHDRLTTKLQQGCITFASGTSSNMSKSLGLLLNASTAVNSPASLVIDIDLMLHPRAPPLVRALPHIESLSLFQAEESNEELDARRQIGIATISETTPLPQPQNTIAVAPSVAPTLIPPVQSAFSTGIPPPTSIHPQSSVPSAISANQVSTPTPASIITSQAKVDAPRPRSPPAQTQSEPPVVAFSSRGPTTVPTTNFSSTIAGGPPQMSRAVDSMPTTKPMVVVDDEDEPIPTIDMGSDSDSE
ncbi:rRNA processing/ribosome biogenesis-domain-containing protein [Irpex rosettiformis]|uniref:rRNA processing/ribosome biogenesis-domain-containing protein n=1 Tax=Irpex rosettiformis TaxID=378272 RepID=A0ACB8U4B7_9APHY|nr:rRNA processing/ribosome biogenesis-domain-containing protein [Irpex rosettiformis]